MSKVVLHIGTHKTGTTTVQDMFWHNAALLAQHGLIYPQLGTITGHHALVCDWMTLPPVFAHPDGSRALLDRMSAAHAAGDDTVFLSSEELSRGDPDNRVNLQELRACLSRFDRIEVVCVLRTQWQFLQSVYLEISKAGSPPRPGVLMQSALQTGMAQGLWVDYRGLLDRLETVFAPEEITLLDYTQACAHPKGLIGALLETQAIDLPVDALQLVNEGRSNASPLALATFAANMLMEPYKADAGLVAQITEVMHHMTQNQPLHSCIFSRAQFDQLQAHFAPLNAELAQRRHAVQPGFHLSEPNHDAITHFHDQLPPGLWYHVARSLARQATQ